MISRWRRLLLPFVPIYAAVVTVKRWLNDHGFPGQRHLHHPVISVGSLSAGGAGKTPVVLMLAELLAQRGFEVRILTRGYGRRSKLTERVDPAGDAALFGDEPLLLARREPGAAVFVGRDRYRAGMLAEQAESPDTRAVYLLDDGFQHQKLAREIEILLITRQDIHDRMLPVGNLREPLRSIQRAHFLILREDEKDIASVIAAQVPFDLPPILTIRRRLSLPEMEVRPARPMIFSGLARPEGFIAMLADCGFDTTATKSFPDHHRYSISDIEDLVTSARGRKADGFATTEKDAVKLSAPMMERLRAVGPVVVARLDVEMVDGASTIDSMLAGLASA